jgi:hypothetical protein
MSLFDGFYRRAVVVIPDDNEYEQRRYKQKIHQQKFIPDSFINQMKGKNERYIGSYISLF